MEEDKIDSGKQVFEANVLLVEAWSYSDGTASFVIDAMHNTHDANGKLHLGESAVFRLSGTHEELQDFIKELQEALSEAQMIERKKVQE